MAITEASKKLNKSLKRVKPPLRAQLEPSEGRVQTNSAQPFPGPSAEQISAGHVNKNKHQRRWSNSKRLQKPTKEKT